MIEFDCSPIRRDYMVLARQFVSQPAKMFCQLAALGMMEFWPPALEHDGRRSCLDSMPFRRMEC
jgi:hypothetical protein